MFRFVTPSEPYPEDKGKALWDVGFHALHLITVEPKEEQCKEHLEFTQIIADADIHFERKKNDGNRIQGTVEGGLENSEPVDTPLKAPVVDIDWQRATKAQRDQMFLPVVDYEYRVWRFFLHFVILVRKKEENGESPGPIIYVKHWYLRAENRKFPELPQVTLFNIFSGDWRNKRGKDIEGYWHNVHWGLAHGYDGGWQVPQWTTSKHLIGYKSKEQQVGPVSGESAKKLAAWASAARK